MIHKCLCNFLVSKSFKYNNVSKSRLVIILRWLSLFSFVGITLNSLCLRLEDHPYLGIDKVDECLLTWIWSGLASTSEVEFYALPEPRPPLVIFKYNAFVQPSACKGIFPVSV